MTSSELVPDDYSPRDVLRRTRGFGALTGTQALTRLLIEQQRADARRGLRTAGLVSGYRGSPLAGLDLTIERNAELLDEHDIRFIPGVNEELGATVVSGSQLATQLPDPSYDGVFGLWYGKSPGVDRSVDAFKHGTWMGTTRYGGVLVAAGDDPANKSSSLPSNSAMALAESHMPVLSPANVADVLRLGRIGFEMSRYTGSWVGFTVVTNVADAYETVDLAADVEVEQPEFTWQGAPWQPTVKPSVTIPEATALEPEVLRARLAAATAFAAANGVDRTFGCDSGARLGLAVSGHAYVQLREALDRLGLDEQALSDRGVKLLRLGLIHPLDPETVRSFTEGLTEIVVVEDKRPFIETQFKELLYDADERPRVYGKHGPDGAPLIPVDGALDSDRLIKAMATFLADRVGAENIDLDQPTLRPRIPSLTLTPVNRTPYFCSGCPHNRSTVVPDGSVAGAGIGCHAMTTFMDRSIGFTQMGGEGVNWVGAEPFTETKHFFQNLGDGTYFHSGSLGVRQAVAAGSNITFKLLYNEAVAMTGGQDVDGSSDPVAITRMLQSEGVRRTVIVTDAPKKYPRRADWAPGTRVRHRDELEDVQRELSTTSGVTVLLYDQACAAENRRKRKRGKAYDPPERVFINEAVCEGCGDCGKKSNCLSVQPVETEFGRKTRIDQESCNKDYSCLLGDCPSFLTVVPDSEPSRPSRPVELPGDLPEPSHRPDSANLVLVGIGGTGVVTTNQVLGTAALLAGLDVRGLDQTGMSQKAGAVVSHLRMADDCGDRPGGVPAGAADGYLAFDALAATSETNLSRCDTGRTVAVASTSEVPPGQLVVDPSATYPASTELLDKISRSTLSDRLTAFDALKATERLFGTEAAANFLVIGVAYQKGLLPPSAEAIERAIDLNGVQVHTNTQAFRAGRNMVLDPDWFHTPDETSTSEDRPREHGRDLAAARELVESTATSGELRRLLDIRVPDLADYQNLAYARRYLDVVNRVRAAERDSLGTQSLAETVASNLYKLMAYKDEYEVARLHLDQVEEVRRQFGSSAKIRYRLHPPMLRAMGMNRKIALGRSANPAFRVLRSLRGLRGTVLDVFGYAKLRRLERELITEYVGVVDRLIARMDPDNHELAVRIAALPDMVRGYEEIKLDSVRAYRDKLTELFTQLDEGADRQPERATVS